MPLSFLALISPYLPSQKSSPLINLLNPLGSDVSDDEDDIDGGFMDVVPLEDQLLGLSSEAEVARPNPDGSDGEASEKEEEDEEEKDADYDVKVGLVEQLLRQARLAHRGPRRAANGSCTGRRADSESDSDADDSDNDDSDHDDEDTVDLRTERGPDGNHIMASMLQAAERALLAPERVVNRTSRTRDGRVKQIFKASPKQYLQACLEDCLAGYTGFLQNTSARVYVDTAERTTDWPPPARLA